jgi:hypothetical protein
LRQRMSLPGAIGDWATLTTYETGDHDIGGVSQVDAGARSVEFASQHGAVKLSELEVVS